MQSRSALTAAGLGLGAVLVLAAPAAAHVTASPSEVPAGGFTAVTLTVPHGCDGSATTGLVIQVPDGIDDVTPQVVPGWDVTIDTEPLDTPVTDEEGNPVTDRETQVNYTAQPGSELQDGFRLTFTVGFRAPDTPGEDLFFKTIQTCEVGETAWIEEYTGEGEEPEHPSPVVAVVESTGGEGHGHGDETAAPAASDDGDDGGDSSDSGNGLAVAGIVVGALGLLVGGIALARAGRQTATS